MAGQGSSKHYQRAGINEPVFNVRVSQPINDSSSKEIRDNILIDFFGYSEFDIIALDEQKKGYFYTSDKAASNDWATGVQVKSWTFNPDGTVRINMPQVLIDSLTEFRKQRASLEIFKVGMFIADAETRKIITDDLEDIFSPSGSKRTTALDDLMITIGGSQTSRGEIFKALRFLTNESGYKTNPYLLIALAATTSYKSAAPAFSSAEVNQEAIANAVKITNDNLYNSSAKNSFSAISNLEAARINYWASSLYDNVGASLEATNRRWIERFLSMSDEERGSYKPGEVIEMLPPGAIAMERLSETQERLKNLELAETYRKKSESDIDQMGSEWVPADPSSSERFQKPSDRLVMTDALVQQKNRQKQKGYVPKFKTVSISQPVFGQANIQSDYAGAIFHVVMEVYKYAAANRRMNDIAVYHYQKRALEKQINNEKIRVVPPRPETIRQAIIYVRRYGRTTADTFTKQNIPPTLRELEAMLEESYAFYKLR